jgi:hypothetical protein
LDISLAYPSGDEGGNFLVQLISTMNKIARRRRNGYIVFTDLTMVCGGKGERTTPVTTSRFLSLFLVLANDDICVIILLGNAFAAIFYCFP